MSNDPLRGLSSYWRGRIMDRVRTRLGRNPLFHDMGKYNLAAQGAHLMRDTAAEVRDEFVRDKGLKWPVEET